MIVVYGYNAASHSLGVALHSGSGGLCRDTVFDIPKPLFVLENWFVWPLVAIYTEAKSLIDSSVSLFVAVGALKSISCFMRFLSWQFQTIDTLAPPFSVEIAKIAFTWKSLRRRSGWMWLKGNSCTINNVVAVIHGRFSQDIQHIPLIQTRRISHGPHTFVHRTKRPKPSMTISIYPTRLYPKLTRSLDIYTRRDAAVSLVRYGHRYGPRRMRPLIKFEIIAPVGS